MISSISGLKVHTRCINWLGIFFIGKERMKYIYIYIYIEQHKIISNHKTWNLKLKLYSYINTLAFLFHSNSISIKSRKELTKMSRFEFHMDNDR